MEKIKQAMELWSALTHPLEAAAWSVALMLAHPEMFVATGLIGLMLWMFGLTIGKKAVQASVAVYVVLCIVSAA